METVAVSNLVGRVTYTGKALGIKSCALLAYWTSWDFDVLSGDTLDGEKAFRRFNRQVRQNDKLKCVGVEHSWKRCLYQLLM